MATDNNGPTGKDNGPIFQGEKRLSEKSKEPSEWPEIKLFIYANLLIISCVHEYLYAI